MLPQIFADHVPAAVNDFVFVVAALHAAAFAYVAVSFVRSHLREEDTQIRTKWQ